MSTETTPEDVNNIGNDPPTVKDLLIENGHLIEKAATCQRMGRFEESLKCQESLRKNLILLAKLAEPYYSAQILQEIGPYNQQSQISNPPTSNNFIPSSSSENLSPLTQQNERITTTAAASNFNNSNISPNQQTQNLNNQITQQQQQQLLLQPPPPQQQQQLYINAQTNIQTTTNQQTQQHFSPSQRHQFPPNPVSPQQQYLQQQRPIPYGIVSPHVYVAPPQHQQQPQQTSLMAAPYDEVDPLDQLRQPSGHYGIQPPTVPPPGFNPQPSAQMYQHMMQQQNPYAPSPHLNTQNIQASGMQQQR
ncbi:hypothetical protein Mgra_00001393 [Meloidogyne graminicola]|uniref:SS18 N-terminal domain-containing protein n=1 Tax=Meloidogyne graminicola TaxID=189291 RepID=A0A8T0A0T7_9BILA|nr:hypothetical protein Mgra_00001393 [Meloidogyne graminicola]